MKQLFIFAIAVLFIACNKRIHTAKIILLPDTQTYAEKYPEVLEAQVKWIKDHKEEIDFVLQQGDLTQNNNDIEWQRVKKAFSSLDHEVPYVLAAGNHDMGSGPGKFADIRNTDLFNQYFPVDKMASLRGFKGTFDNRIENTFYLFDTGKVKWLILSLEFGPRNSVLNWADSIVSKHPDKLVILNTHAYMYADSTRQNEKDYWRPQAYGIGKDTGVNEVNDGEQIWEKLVKKHSNIRFVFSGHVLNSGVGTLVSINEKGFPVYQMLANYQEGVKGSVMGGNGWLRILEMDFKKEKLEVRTYSPFIDQSKDDAAHSFVIRKVMYEPDEK
jgi:3',5'-cyclic AMP phosphodiesterase CpdA